MNRSVRRNLAAALRRQNPGGWWESTAVIARSRRLTETAPVWSPGPGYLEVLTATVWACPAGGPLVHAVAVIDGALPGQRVLACGPVAGDRVVGLGGLTDKPHRIRWLAVPPPAIRPLGDNHPALSYQDWIDDTERMLNGAYRRLLRARHLHGSNQVRLSATPSGGFCVTVAVEIEPGAYRRYDIAAHAAALSALLRRLGPGTRLRFHPATAEHLTDALYHHAWRRLRGGHTSGEACEPTPPDPAPPGPTRPDHR